MNVRLKKEIISLGLDHIKPAEFTGEEITPTEFKEWLDAGKEVHLNLSNVQYMDSSGISVLIESHQKALEKNTKVIIKDVSKSVLKVIMMAKLEQILNLE